MRCDTPAVPPLQVALAVTPDSRAQALTPIPHGPAWQARSNASRAAFRRSPRPPKTANGLPGVRLPDELSARLDLAVEARGELLGLLRRRGARDHDDQRRTTP